MACACPIVTTCVEVIPEMPNIENGRIHGVCVDPKDVDGLRGTIQKMLDNREYILDCGRYARKRVNELNSMSKVWNQSEIIWLSL